MTTLQINHWRKPILLIIASVIGVMLVAILSFALSAPRQAASVAAWQANQRVAESVSLPSVQSNVAIGIGGAGNNQIAFAWTDERNTLADIYANVHTGTVFARNNERTTELTAMFPVRDYASAVAVDATGATYIASTYNGADVFLARRTAANTYVSRTEVTVNSPYWGALPAMAGRDDGMLVLVWQDRRYPPYNRWDIYSSVCDGNTMTCTVATRVNDTITTTGTISNHQYPQVAQHGQKVIAVWEDQRELGSELPRVYASISNDGGYTWQPNMKVGNVTGTASTMRPSAAIDVNGNPWVAYEYRAEGTTTPADIYVTQWTGTAWTTPVRIDTAPDGKRAANPVIASDTVGQFVIWEDYRTSNQYAEIRYARLSGNTWVEGLVSNVAAAKYRPTVAVKGNQVWAAWQDSRNGQPDIRTVRWNGATWVDETQVNEDTNRISYQSWPLLATSNDGNKLQMTWLDNRQNRLDLFTSRYNRTTQSWGAPIQLPNEERGTSSLSYYRNAATAFDASGVLNVVWQESKVRNGTQSFLLHSKYDDATATWSPPIMVHNPVTTTTYGIVYGVSLDSKANKTVAVWAWRAQTGFPYTMTLLSSRYDGLGWSVPITVATGLNYEAHPAVAVASNGDSYAVWAGMVPTGTASYLSDIYVARLPNGGSSWGAPVKVNSISSTSTSCVQRWPVVHIDASGVLHLAWSACRQDGSRGIGYARSTDNGVTWTPTVFYGGGTSADSAPTISSRSTPDGTEIMLTYLAIIDGKPRYAATRFNPQAGEGVSTISDVIDTSVWSLAYDGAPSTLYDVATGQYIAAFADRRTGPPQIFTSKFVPSPIVSCPAPPPEPLYVTDAFNAANTALWSYTANQTANYSYCGGQVVQNRSTTGLSYSTLNRTTYSISNRKVVKFDFKFDQADPGGLFILQTNGDLHSYRVYTIYGMIYFQSRTNGGAFGPARVLFDAVRTDTWYHIEFALDDAVGLNVSLTELVTGKTATLTQPVPAGQSWRLLNYILRGTSYMDNYVETEMAGNATMSLIATQPTTGTFLIERPITVAVQLSNTNNLGGFEFTLGYSPTQLAVEAISIGTLPTATGRTFVALPPTIDNANGSATFGAYSTGYTPTGVTGSGVLAYVRVRPLIDGAIPLNITDAQVMSVLEVPAAVARQGTVFAVGNTCLGDFDQDRDVDIVDVQGVAYRWDSVTGQSRYLLRYDTERDGDIDIQDVQRVASRWGTRCPGAVSQSASFRTQGRTQRLVELGSPALALQLENSSVKSGDLIRVAVTADQAAQLRAYQFSLALPSDTLEFIGYDASPDMTPDGYWVNLPTLNEDGVVTIGAYSLGESPATATSPLGWLLFRATKTGQVELNLDNIQLVDKNMQAIDAPSATLQVSVSDSGVSWRKTFIPIVTFDVVAKDN